MFNRFKCGCLVSITALVAGCGGVTDATGDRAPNAEGFGLENTDPVVCATASSGISTWAAQFPDGPFTLEFAAAVEGREQDVLFGFANGPVERYSDLAGIVRFNPAGKVDARNGGSYVADNQVPYTPFSMRQFRMDVDPAAHRYTVKSVSPAGVVTIGEDFAFRSEQATTSSFDHLALIADAGGIGVCDMLFEGACRHVTAGGGFWNHTVPTQSEVSFTAAVTATPGADNMDGVIGFGGDVASRYQDLSVAVRFNPDGFIDARNGGGYAAAEAIPYSAGTSYTFKFFVDPVLHRYTVFVNGQLLGKGFAFRGELPYESYFHHGAAIADAGELDVCDFTTATPERLIYGHDLESYPPNSLYDLVPLDNAGLLDVSRTETRELNYQGSGVRTLPWGGSMAGIDFAQNRYLAGEFAGTYAGGGTPVTETGEGDIYVSKYDADWNNVYTRALGTPGHDTMVRLAVNGGGEVAVRSWDVLYRLDANGDVLWTRDVSDTNGLLALDDQGNVYVHQNPIGTTEFQIRKYDAANQPVWVKTGYAPEGYSTVQELKPTPDGKLIVTGNLQGQLAMDDLLLKASPEGTFVFELDADGSYLWGQTFPGLAGWTGIGVDGAGRPTICTNELGPNRMHLIQIAADGSSAEVMSNRDLLSGFDDTFTRHCAVDRRGDAYVTGTGSLDTGFVSVLMKLRAPF